MNLGMLNCLVLKQSFNRSNLYYEVRPKTDDIISQIHAFITSTYPDSSGLIYCTSRISCEIVAYRLRDEFGLSAPHYHAGLDKSDRLRIQNSWQEGDILVIVATMAFGMGIDKSNVRFVIHYSHPRSIEGYYQETGRAGRDGNSAHCLLFYSTQDKIPIEYLIRMGAGSASEKQIQRDNLQHMIRYCENRTDCRRTQLLSYFDECFSPAHCAHSCDNCKQGQDPAVEEKSYKLTNTATCSDVSNSSMAVPTAPPAILAIPSIDKSMVYTGNLQPTEDDTHPSEKVSLKCDSQLLVESW
ncbi:ATP-dependent DNA helicase sgs1 [Mortierella alpina]|nr:ATP-dependent DNA helicase sgs1 [Mortierella alpina]